MAIPYERTSNDILRVIEIFYPDESVGGVKSFLLFTIGLAANEISCISVLNQSPIRFTKTKHDGYVNGKCKEKFAANSREIPPCALCE